MTPSTSILNYLASRQDKLGIAVEQAEDEIAAINMAIGASYGGAGDDRYFWWWIFIDG